MTYDFYKSPCLCSVFSNASGEDKHVSQYVCAVLATGRIRNERAFLHISGGQSTQIKYLSKSTDTYNKILLQ